MRFDNPFDTGFQTVYESYTNGGLAYSFYRVDFPNALHFALFDIRNIPLHIYTLFMHYSQGWVQYGNRFMLDHMPFSAMLTVMGFDDRQSQKARAVQILLIAVSVASG